MQKAVASRHKNFGLVASTSTGELLAPAASLRVASVPARERHFRAAEYNGNFDTLNATRTPFVCPPLRFSSHGRTLVHS